MRSLGREAAKQVAIKTVASWPGLWRWRDPALNSPTAYDAGAQLRGSAVDTARPTNVRVVPDLDDELLRAIDRLEALLASLAVWEMDAEVGLPAPFADRKAALRSGFTPEKEAEILAAWRARKT